MARKISYPRRSPNSFLNAIKRYRDDLGQISKAEPQFDTEIELFAVSRKTGRPLKISQRLRKVAPKQGFTTPLRPELSKVAVEFDNPDPLPLTPVSLSEKLVSIRRDITGLDEIAEELGAQLLMMGSLPTANRSVHTSDEWLELELPRYRDLMDCGDLHQGGHPRVWQLAGCPPLRDIFFRDEALTASVQVNMSCAPEEYWRMHHAMCVLQPMIISLFANSPFLYGELTPARATRPELFRASVSGPRSTCDLSGGWIPKRYRNQFSAAYVLRQYFEQNRPILAWHKYGASELDSVYRRLKFWLGNAWDWVRLRTYVDHVQDESRIADLPPTPEEIVALSYFTVYGVRALCDMIEDPADLVTIRGSKKLYQKSHEQLTRDLYLACAPAGIRSEIWWRGKRVSIDSAIVEVLDRANTLYQNDYGRKKQRNPWDEILQDLRLRGPPSELQRSWYTQLTDGRGYSRNRALKELVHAWGKHQLSGKASTQWPRKVPV